MSGFMCGLFVKSDEKCAFVMTAKFSAYSILTGYRMCVYYIRESCTNFHPARQECRRKSREALIFTMFVLMIVS